MNIDQIRLRAEQFHGAEAIDLAMSELAGLKVDLSLSDDRILSLMTRGIFCAGFSWKVVYNKWDGFEEAFSQFDIGKNAFMSDDQFDKLIQNTNIIRNATKIRSVQHNAVFVSDLAREYGSAVQAFAQWPSSNYFGLVNMLKKNGQRLGGNTGTYFLRTIGVPGFIFSNDVVSALVREGIVDKTPTSQKAFAQLQQASDEATEKYNLNMAQISRLLALSVGPSGH